MMTDTNEQLPKMAMGFSAIGSEQRLKVLRTLVKAGDRGLNVSQIKARTDIAPSTLFHHLQFLTSADLVTQDKHGREVRNVANFDAIRTLSDFILEECCVDAPPHQQKKECCHE